MKNSWFRLLVTTIALLTWCASYLSAVPALHTSGNLLLDSNGNIVALRGFALVSAEASGKPQYIYRGKMGLDAAKAMIDDIKWNYRANVVRIPIDPETISGHPIGVKGWFTDSVSYWNNYLKPIVSYIIQQNLYVILDFHLVGPFDDNTKDKIIAFWKFITDQKIWNNHRQILFEIYSGPSWWGTDNIPGDVSDYGTAGSMYANLRNQVNQPVVDFIRNTAKCNNIIIAGAPVWDQIAVHALDYPLAGGNIMYALHLYPNQTDYVRMYRRSDYNPACMSTFVPTIATEWGLQTFDNSDLPQDYCGGANYYMMSPTSSWGTDVLAWMETGGIHWLACTFDAYQVYCGPRIFRNSNFLLADSNTNYFGNLAKTGMLKNSDLIPDGVTDNYQSVSSFIINNNQISSPTGALLKNWQIVDLLGQTILSVETPTTLLDISNLNSGCYFLRARTDTKIISQKFIKY